MSDLKISELPVIGSATDDDYLVINDGNITTSTLTWSDLKSSINILTGQIEFATAGTELAPTIFFNGDINTGIYSPGADQLSFVTNGDTAVFIDAEGKMGLGNESPSSYDPAANGIVIGSATGSDFGVTIASNPSNRASIYFADGTNDGERNVGRVTYDHNVDDLLLFTNNGEKVRITSEGNLGIGTNDPQDLIHISAGDSGVVNPVSGVQGVIVEADGSSNAAVQFHTNNTATAGVYFGDPEDADASHIVYDHATNDLGIGVGGTEQIVINSLGAVGLNTQPVLGNMVTLGGVAAGLPDFVAFGGEVSIGTAVTNTFSYYQSEAATEDVSFTLNNLYHFRARQESFGASSTVTNQYGFYADVSINNGTNNYGFYSGVSGTNNYSFYSENNAKAYFNSSEFKVANGGVDALTVFDGITTVDEGIVVGGGTTAERPTEQLGLLRFNTELNTWEGWNGSNWISVASAPSLQATTDIGNHSTNDIELGGVPGIANLWLNADGTIEAGTTPTDSGARFGLTGNRGFFDAYAPSTDSNDFSIFSITDVGGAGQTYRVDKGGSVRVGGTLPGNPNVFLNTDGSGHFSAGAFSVATDGALNIASGAATISAAGAGAFASVSSVGAVTADSASVGSGSNLLNADGSVSFASTSFTVSTAGAVSAGAISSTGTVSSVEGTITAGAWDLSSGNFWTCGAITVPNPTNATTGTSGLIRLTDAPTGWGGNIKHPGGAAETVTAFPAIVPFYVQDSSTILIGKAIQGIS